MQIILLAYIVLISLSRLYLNRILEKIIRIIETCSMNSLIQPPQISQQIISKMVESIYARYQLKEVIPTREFGQDTARVFEQLQLYSSTILQLQTLNTASNLHLLEQFHQNMFKYMRFLSKLITKLSKYQSKEAETHKIEQICMNCKDNMQDRNIKLVKRELYDFNLPNFDRNLDDENSQNHKNEEEFIDSEESLIRKMTKLQKNVNERQIGLIKCLQEFQVARNQMTTYLTNREQKEKDCLAKFNYHDYAFKISWFFVNELKKIEDKINSLKLSVKKQEDKGIQVICVEMGISKLHQNMPLSLLKSSQNYRSGNLKTELELKKSNETRSKLEEIVKHYQVETKEMQTKVQVLQDQIKDLHQQIFEQKLKTNTKSKSIKHIEKLPKSLSKSRKQIKEELKQHQKMISHIINEDKDLSNQLQERIVQKCNDLKLSKDKIKGILPLFKSAFKKTVNTYINRRLNSTVGSKKMIKFEKNDDEEKEDKIQNKIVSKKGNAPLSMDRPALKEGTRVGTIRTGAHFKITSQCTLKIISNSNKQGQQLSQSSKIQERKGTFADYKKSMLLTEGNFDKRNHSRFSSTFYEPKSTEYFKQKLDSVRHRRSRQFGQMQTNFQSLKILGYESNEIKLKVPPINRNKSQQQIHTPCKIIKNKVTLNNLLQIYKIDCTLMDEQVLKDFIRNQKRTSEQEEYQQKLIGTTKIKDLSKFSPISSHKLLNKGYSNKIILRIDEINYLTSFYTLMARAHIIHPKLYNQIKTSLFQQSPEKENSSEDQSNLMMMKKMLGQIVVRHRKCIKVGICSHMKDFLSALQQSLNQVSLQRQSK